MDAKITKKRLNIFLSYDWIKILLAAVAAILVWSLIFTTAATRVTQAQNFTIFNYTGTKGTSRFNSYSTLLREKNVFSYDILEISSTDITTGEQYSETLLQTRVSTGEGDALFAANINEGVTTKYKDDQGNEFAPTYLEQFLYGYHTAAATFGEGGYLDQMADYLNGYYQGDYKTHTIDEQKVETDFRVRIKRLNDKRFKKESQIREGLKQEIQRIESYKTSLTSFLSYLEKGYVALQETTLYLQDLNGKPLTRTDYYRINLCPNEKMEDLKKDVCYYKTITDEDGEKKIASAENVCLVLMDLAEEKYSYSRFEGLSFVNYLVETHCSDLNA
ncbi:MAG: hypothetical protein KH054_00860 [Firmicutes bacterium]|nr:hypothetical protein [Bacillota bacterium]